METRVLMIATTLALAGTVQAAEPEPARAPWKDRKPRKQPRRR